MKKSLILLLEGIISLFLIGLISAGVSINEVEAKANEFIEIYNPDNENLNLSEWKIKDDDSQDNIVCDNIPNCSLIINATYFIIIGENTNINNITSNNIIYFRVDDGPIGSGLNNEGDNLSFFNSTFSINYNYTEHELDKSWQYCSGDWLERNPTPGEINNCSTSQEENNDSGSVEISIELDWDEDEIINGKEFEIEIKFFNLQDENYDVKVWIEFEDNDTIISDRYGEDNKGEDKWISGRYYIYNLFNGPGNDTEDVKLRIRDDYENYYGEVILFVKIKGGIKQEEDIEILKAEKEEGEETAESEDETSETISTPSITVDVINLGGSLSKTEDIKTKKFIVYESKTELIKKYSMFGFAFLCVGLSVLLIFNKLG